jgi:hypothetical protein
MSKECKHKDKTKIARIWLKSRNYVQGKICLVCNSVIG